MKVAMPTGTSHGWGIAGSHLAEELAKLPRLDGVTLHCISGHDFKPFNESAWDTINIGYCFFEHELLAARFMPAAAQRWDHIVAGSRWCEQQLRVGGIEHTSTILQGVDSRRFAVQPPRRADGRFIVFSGGKFEFRKGQDIVIAAMRVFMQRHPDVWLSCAWHNPWPQSLQTMEQSSLIAFDWKPDASDQLFFETIVRNGIDPARVTLHPAFKNERMALIYAESDLGLFPNRCEGGTNLVMCEYMACGRPVIASNRSGQADIVTVENAWPLAVYRQVEALTGGMVTGRWQEVVIEDLLEKLEAAYADPTARQARAAQAAAGMRRLSWPAAARQFYELGEKICAERKQGLAITTEFRMPGCEEADRLFDEERYGEAHILYSELLRQSPLNTGLMNRIGTVLDRLGRFSEAATYYNKALCRDPGLSVVQYNLANTVRHLGDDAGAEEYLKLALLGSPDFIEAWKSLALLYVARNASADAAVCFERLVQLAPVDAENYCALASLYAELGRLPEAATCLKELLAQQPEHLLALETLGTVFHELENLEQAEECYRHVLAAEPFRVSAINNLGTVLRSQNRLDEALQMFNRALALEPHNGQVRFNRSLTRLMRNELPEAWDEYEARFETVVPPHLYHQDLPRWDGTALGGKSLLVQSEQGFGDTFQFARYLPFLAERVDGPVVFECQNHSVLEGLYGLKKVRLIARGDCMAGIDCQIPLVSLPRLFQTELCSIPLPEGYLKPQPHLVEFWKKRLGEEYDLKVGLVWGGKKNSLNANRSLHLDQLSLLFELPGVSWFSLQVGEDAQQLSNTSGQIVDLGSEIRHFGDTAAIITSLDLLLTIDSAVAHLAGGLGMPVWIMLKYAADWRWLLERADSPWYRSAVLFRQKQPGGWGAVVAMVREKLVLLLDDHKKRAKVLFRD